MRTKKFKTLIVALGGLLFSLQAFPQNGQADGSSDWKNNEVCLKNLSLYYEYYKHKNYDDAIKPWRIVYQECPESKESLYAYGVNMYHYFIEKEKDPAVRAALADTMMMIYDKRIEYFPAKKGDILGRKGVDLLRYRRQDGIEYIQQGYNILKSSIEIEGKKSNPVILTTYISAGITLFMNGELDNESVIKDYITASDIIDGLLARRPTSRVKQAKEAIDTNIKESNVLTCEAINKIFKPKYEENKEDKKFLMLITGFMSDAGCELEPFYATAAEQLYILDPSSEAAYNLGRLFFKKDDYQKAKSYYIEAIERTEDAELKANYYYELGVIAQQYLNSPQQAVQYGFEAIKYKPDFGEPYILVGTSYAAGSSNFTDNFEKKTAYWVAVDMFNKAKVMDPSIADKAAGHRGYNRCEYIHLPSLRWPVCTRDHGC